MFSDARRSGESSRQSRSASVKCPWGRVLRWQESWQTASIVGPSAFCQREVSLEARFTLAEPLSPWIWVAGRHTLVSALVAP